MQVLQTQEDLNFARRRVLRGEKNLGGVEIQRDEILEAIVAAKDELAAGHQAVKTSEEKLAPLMKEKAEPQEESGKFTEEEVRAVMRMRSIRAGEAGPQGGLAYQQAIAEVMDGTKTEHSRGEATPAKPAPGRPGPAGKPVLKSPAKAATVVGQ
eukprot:8072399-Heterocapsa_arctica.AAC.1